MRAPVIAEVNGTVAGAGLGLMAAADFAIASEKAKFTSAYTKIGLTPDGSTTWFLPRLIGHRRAKELFLLNRLLSAEEAMALGLSQSCGGSCGPVTCRCSSCRATRQRADTRLRVGQAASDLERRCEPRAADES